MTIKSMLWKSMPRSLEMAFLFYFLHGSNAFASGQSSWASLIRAEVDWDISNKYFCALQEPTGGQTLIITQEEFSEQCASFCSDHSQTLKRFDLLCYFEGNNVPFELLEP